MGLAREQKVTESCIVGLQIIPNGTVNGYEGLGQGHDSQYRGAGMHSLTVRCFCPTYGVMCLKRGMMDGWLAGWLAGCMQAFVFIDGVRARAGVIQ